MTYTSINIVTEENGLESTEWCGIDIDILWLLLFSHFATDETNIEHLRSKIEKTQLERNGWIVKEKKFCYENG